MRRKIQERGWERIRDKRRASGGSKTRGQRIQFTTLRRNRSDGERFAQARSCRCS